MVKAPKRKATTQPETKSLCFPSKNVCHSNLEPAAQLYGQTEQVYSHNCTYNFHSIGHKISARMRAREIKIRGNIATEAVNVWKEGEALFQCNSRSTEKNIKLRNQQQWRMYSFCPVRS